MLSRNIINHLLYKGIARKLIISTILFSSFITLIITTTQLYQSYKYDLEIIDSRFQQIKDVHLTSVTNNLWLADKKETLIQLNGILKTPDIQYLEIKEGDKLWVTAGTNKEQKTKSKTYPLTYTYKGSTLAIGSLSVIASLDNAYQHIYDNALMVLITNGIKTSLVAFFIFILFYNIISRHLTKISDFALKNNSLTSNKTLSLNRKSSHEDELDIVVAAINNMRLRLSEQLDELNQQKQYLSLTLNSIGDAVITTDNVGNITSMNLVAENLTGWKTDEALGSPVKKVFSIIDASTRKPIENPIDKVISTGKTVYLSNHTTLISTDGTEYQITDSAAPIRDSDMIVHGMVLVFNDVTEAYALRQEKQYILENMVDGIFTVDEKGLILNNNQSANILFGYKPEDTLGHYLNSLIPEFNIQEYNKSQLSNSTSSNFNSRKAIILKAVRNDGEPFPIQILVRELPGHGTQHKRFIVTCHDLTIQTQQEEQLRRSQKMDALGKLTGGVAHDYNNMLGVIMGYAEILQEKLEDKPDLLAHAEKIYLAGQRGAQLTKKLLSFSSQRQFETHTININAELKKQKDMLTKTLTVRIQVVMDLDEDLWPVELESGELVDVILNLSINAMHAMNDRGTLTFKSRNEKIDEADINYMELHPGEYVVLSVSDTGTGMDKITQNRMFDPFFSTKGEKGTGLGLSQVYGFMQRSHGGIKVYSEQGHGTRIVLYFPRVTTTESLPTTPKLKEEKHNKGHESILVVDDEPALVNLAYDILKSNGYHVLTANNAEEALIMLTTETVDLLVSDIIMPGMDGYQLASQVKQNYPQIKIILCSGFDDGRHADMVDDTLKTQMILKPYSSKSLLKQVRALLDSNAWIQ